MKITTKSHNYGTWKWWFGYTFVPDPSKPITPLHVTVDFFNRSATSWNLPYIDDEGYGHGQEIERTICITKDDYKNTKSQMSIIFSTTAKDAQVSVQINTIPDYIITNPMDKPLFSLSNSQDNFSHIASVSIGSPQFYYVDLSNITGYLEVSVKSDDILCGTVSIHPLKCPLSECSEVKTENTTIVQWQNMFKFAVLTINADEYIANMNEKGFFIKFTAYETDCKCNPPPDYSCGRRNNGSSSIKTFHYKITKYQPFFDIHIILAILMIFLISTFIIMIMGFYFYFTMRTNEEKMNGKGKNYLKECANICNVHDCFTKTMPSHIKDQQKSEGEIPNPLSNPDSKKIMKNKIGKNNAELYQQNELYIWMVLLLGICYIIPALQLAFKHQKILSLTGDQNLCYYNYLCSVTGPNLSNFNHLFSNIGYIIYGFVFLIIVWMKQWRYKHQIKSMQQNEDEANVKRGIPQFFGIFYSLGFALIFQGILSACYHACPTRENFQFDTTFMYVTAALLIIKIYQLRHPGMSSNAYKVFLGISVVIFLNVIGIFQQNTTFWVFLTILETYAIAKLSVILLTTGRWNRPYQGCYPWDIYKKYCKDYSNNDTKSEKQKSEPKSKMLIVFVIFFNIINFGILIHGNYRAYQKPISLPNFFLLIMIGNLMMYFLYYWCMKIAYKEAIPMNAYIIALLAIIFWVPALWLFQAKEKTTMVSPAVSRNMNSPCVVSIFDKHDLWHFLSATGLFLNFLILLIIDDGIAEQPRTKIPVF